MISKAFRYCRMAALAVALMGLSTMKISAQVQLTPTLLVPRDSMHVFLMIGHSNMGGVDTILDSISDPRAWNFYIPDCCNSYPVPFQWYPARDPIFKYRSPIVAGPVMPFIKELLKKYPDPYFGVIMNCYPGAWCTSYQKGVASSTYAGDLYGAIVGAALKIKDKVTLSGIICMLGIVEACDADSSYLLTYSQEIAKMVQQLRDTLKMPDLPFMMGELEQNTTVCVPKLQAEYQLTADQIMKVPSIVANSAIIPSDSIPLWDNHHYTNAGFKIWVKRAVQIIHDKKWLPTPFNHLEYPNGGESLHVGDTIHILWESDTSLVVSAVVKISADSGKTWSPIVLGSIPNNNPAFGNLQWVIPLKVGSQTIADKNCLLQIVPYDSPRSDRSDSFFHISSTAGVRDNVARNTMRKGPNTILFLDIGNSRAAPRLPGTYVMYDILAECTGLHLLMGQRERAEDPLSF